MTVTMELYDWTKYKFRLNKYEAEYVKEKEKSEWFMEWLEKICNEKYERGEYKFISK